MKILIIGQCTLHWGRMEFGNIGNFYIIEPFMRELRSVFPNCEIRTTMQLSDDFCNAEGVDVVPMELYYGWSGTDAFDAEKELEIAKEYVKTKELKCTTPYIDEVLNADLVIDFSGDIWGDNADFLGEDRFHVGLCKDRVAQLLGKKTVMVAGSPGPFSENKNLEFAKEVFENFDFVTNRESVSRDILTQYGFNLNKLHDLACPAFLFEPKAQSEIKELLDSEGISNSEKPVVGFILCGWNFLTGPFDKWPREDSDYTIFAEAVEHLDSLGAKVCLMSHSNGFIPGKEPFELIHGRDYVVTKQLERILNDRGIAKNVICLNGVYDTWTTKGIIGAFSMLVSGRIHAAVAGLSQYVPTVVIDYGHEPKAHKLKGFAIEAGAEAYVADPALDGDLNEKIDKCWNNIEKYQDELKQQIPKAKEKAKKNFKLMKELF
ncbi:polysaccharide pyruvyl transferase family protein [Pedobacter sp. Du54]|uniref:polysaccharide pyruvyl transferase family protein n=1 Tax=Pedobacter anseongensis TaxID=3133439 RepID=UPI00309E2B3D